jgi:hypothetical protein
MSGGRRKERSLLMLLSVSYPLRHGGIKIVERLAHKETVEKLAKQWKKLWKDRVDDKFRAEGIANVDYSMLSVEKGTVIFASRNFKMLSFREILELHGIVAADRFVPPNPQVGGWRKFIRTMIVNKKTSKRTGMATLIVDRKKRQQLKKGGRGWLHF